MNDHVIINPKIQHGKPVIKGIRVPITRIIGGLASGMTKYEVSETDILAALSYVSYR